MNNRFEIEYDSRTKQYVVIYQQTSLPRAIVAAYDTLGQAEAFIRGCDTFLAIEKEINERYPDKE